MQFIMLKHKINTFVLDANLKDLWYMICFYQNVVGMFLRSEGKKKQYVILFACLSVYLSICLSVCQTLSLLGTQNMLVYFNDARWNLHI